VDAIEGVLEGLDDDGVLLVRTDDGALARVRSGTLRERP
jgi:biotin-(acetyl-CoA carboxylase) ligase